MPEEFPMTIAWRRRLGFWDDVRWTRRCDLKKWGGGVGGSVVGRDGYKSP